MLKLPEDKLSLPWTLILILIAYAVSFGLRLLWVHDASGIPDYYWNNVLMITTGDGYVFAKDAYDLLQGTLTLDQISPIEQPMAQLTYWCARLLPFSFETIILYLPAVIGSLIVIPIVLIGHALGQTRMGFVAALLAGIAHSYYNRTMVGYYDTDMLNIVLPVFELYALIFALTHQRNRYLIPITLTFALYQWWYPQAYALNSALLGVLLIYGWVWDRYNHYLYRMALFVLIGILALSMWIKLAIAIALFGFFHSRESIAQRYFWYLFGGMIALYFGSGGFDPIWPLIKGYLMRSNIDQGALGSLHYYNVMNTISEVQHIDIPYFMERISGHPILFALALMGYIGALIAYRPLILSLPLVGLGFLAPSFGLRFTIYAVPVVALGWGYWVVFVTHFFTHRVFRWSMSLFLVVLSLYPNYLHIREYAMGSVFSHNEVATLDRLKSHLHPNDDVVAWWDYGYPIRYYTHANTWADGGMHSGDINYPLSLALLSPDQRLSANLLRLIGEYNHLKGNATTPTFEYAMRKEGFNDPDEFLTTLSLSDLRLPPKTHDIYLYLPFRMLDILPTVDLFSNINLTDPSANPPEHFLYMVQGGDETDETVELGNGIAILKATNTIRIGAQELPIKNYFQVGYDTKRHLVVEERHFASEGISIINLSSYGRVLVMDDAYFNSTYIQLFFLERYDPNLFTPVSLDPLTKIYKLKL